MKITLAQQPAIAAAIRKNSNLTGAHLTTSSAGGAEVFLAPADPIAGNAGDLFREESFAAELTDSTNRLTSVFPDLRVSFDTGPRTFRTREGSKVTFVTVTDPTGLTQAVNAAATHGTQVLAISAALPFHLGAPEARRAELVAAAARHDMTIAFCNRVGGADAHVYDGGSMLVSSEGTVVYQAPLFTDALATIDVDFNVVMEPDNVTAWPDTYGQVWAAMVTGTRDYVRHNGFTSVVLGLSGGIDSAIAATVAVDALGPENVHGIGMPGPYSSDHSVTDAEVLASNLGIRFDLVSIKDTYEAEVAALGALLDGPGAQVARENIQARLRALHLMTISNVNNSLVLNTCNKSEDAVGYATIGGDAMGAYAPLADVPKTLAYRLAAWRNQQGVPVIPEGTLTKAPSAELSPGQQDNDTLPEYDVLDQIMDRYLTGQDTPEDIVTGVMTTFAFSNAKATETVAWVLKMIDRTEWKRQQGPVGPQITTVPFASRKVPITNGRVHHTATR